MWKIDFKCIILSIFPGKVLQATDRRKVTFLDVLIECDQKMVVSNAAVSFFIVNNIINNDDHINAASCLHDDDNDDWGINLIMTKIIQWSWILSNI